MFTKAKLAFAAFIAFIVLASCNSNQKSNDAITNSGVETDVAIAQNAVINGYVKIGDSISKAAFLHLSSKLKSVIDTGGFAQAVSFCSVEALPLTQQIADKYDVKIQRIAQKYRNPFNKPNANDKLVIDDFTNSTAPVVIESDKAFTYYKPIGTKGLCLNCHGIKGKTLNEDALTAIAQKYPMDNAIGFNEGDLRGAWKITFKR
ncbi:MAG: Tll0287-like domain-containing protein [Bacteroidia bacterium]